MEKIYFPRILEEISNTEAITILELRWFYFENSLIIYTKISKIPASFSGPKSNIQIKV